MHLSCMYLNHSVQDMSLCIAAWYLRLFLFKFFNEMSLESRNVSETYIPPPGAKFVFIFSVEVTPVGSK